MAKNEDLLVNIELDTKAPKRGVEDLNKALSDNTKQSRKMQDELKKLEKEYKSIATAIKKLPSQDIEKLGRASKKAEKAAKGLADQVGRTGEKVERVRERVVGAEQAFGVLISTMVLMGKLDAPIAFANRIYKATNAIVTFNEAIVPLIKNTERLVTTGFKRAQSAVTAWNGVFKAATGTIQEQIAIRKGFNTVLIHSNNLMPKFNDALRLTGKAAVHFERAGAGVRAFVAETRDGITRVNKLFGTLSSGAKTTSKIFGEFNDVLFGTFGRSSGSAAQVNLFQQALLELQYRAEIVGKKISQVFVSVSASISGGIKSAAAFTAAFAKGGLDKGINLLKSGFAKLSPILSSGAEKAMEFSKVIDAMTARALPTMIKGMVAGGVSAFKFFENLGILGRGFIGTIDNLNLMGSTLFTVGSLLKSTDSQLLQLAGTAVQVAGVFALTLSGSLVILTGVIGGLLLKIGGSLFSVMDKWEEKFIKLEQVTRAFQFTIRGFGRELGETAVGSLDFWSKKVEEMRLSTAFGIGEIQKGIKILIAEGQALGISAADNAKLLKTAGDLAAVTGADLERVSLAIARALAGNAGSLQDLGIFVTDAALQSSKYVKANNLVLTSLNKTQKAQVVMNSIFEQTKPVVGAAADQLNTMAGASRQLDQSVDLLQAKLGSQSEIFTKLVLVQTAVVNALNNMSPAILDIIGQFVDVVGAVALATGAFLSVLVTVASVKSMFELVNTVIVRSITVQAALNAVLGVAAARLNIQIVAITSLRTAMIGLYQVTVAAAVGWIKAFNVSVLTAIARTQAFAASLLLTRAGWASMITGALAATKAVGAFTLALLTNPLFLKGAAIITVIVAASTAIGELSEALAGVSPDLAEAGAQAGVLEKAVAGISGFFSRAFQGVVGIVKLVIVGFLKLIEAVKIAYIGFKKLVSLIPGMSGLVGSINDLNGELDDSLTQLDLLDREVSKVISGGTAMAATYKNAAGQVAAAAEAGKGFSKALQFDPKTFEALKVDVLGTEVEKAKQKFDELNATINKLRDGGVIQVGTEFLMPSDENLRKLEKGMLDKDGNKAVRVPATVAQIAEADLERQRQALELTKMRESAVMDLTKTMSDLNVQELEANGKNIEAIRARGALEIAEVQKLIAEQKKIAPLTAQQTAQFDKMLSKLQSVNDLKVFEKQKEQLATFNAAMKDLVDENSKLSTEIASIGATAEDIARMQLDAQLDVLDAQAKEIEISKVFNEQQKKALLEQIRLRKILAGVKVEEEIKASSSAADKFRSFTEGGASRGREGDIKAMQEAANQMTNAMTDGPASMGASAKQFMSAGTGMVSGMLGAVSGFMAVADAIADFIQKLIDFLPNFINKIANIFKSLEEFPAKFADAILNLNKSFEGFIKNFIPNIIKNFAKFFSGILQHIFGGLQNAVAEMFDNIGAALEDEMLNTFPKMIENALGSAFGKGTNRMITRFVAMFPRIWKAFIKGLPILVKAIVNGIKDAVKSFINDISRAFGRGKIFNLPDDMEKSMSKLGKKIGKANEQLFRVLDLEAEAKAAKLSTQLNPERIGKSIWEAIKRAFVMARDFFNQLGSMIWMGFFQPVVDWFKEKGEDIWLGLKDQAARDLAKIKEWGQKIWEGLKDQVNKDIGILSEWGGKIWEGFKARTTQDLAIVEGLGTSIWNGFLKPIGNWFGEAGTKLWSGFVTGMETFRDTIGGVLTKVGNTFATTLEGIPGKLQASFDKLNPQNLLEKVFKTDSKGQGDVEKLLKIDVPWSNFARGGIIGGIQKVAGDSPLNDIVPVLASPGEAFIPKSIMENPVAKGIVDALLSGKIPTLADARDLIMEKLVSGMRGQFDNPFGFYQGGLVPGGAGLSGNMIGDQFSNALSGMRSGTVNNDVTIEVHMKIDASSQSLDATYVRNKLIPELKKELKQSSLRGEFLLSPRGLR